VVAIPLAVALAGADVRTEESSLINSLKDQEQHKDFVISQADASLPEGEC
jgi:hypothetical protein